MTARQADSTKMGVTPLCVCVLQDVCGNLLSVCSSSRKCVGEVVACLLQAYLQC